MSRDQTDYDRLMAKATEGGEAVPVGYVTPEAISEVAAGRIGGHLFPKGTLRPINEVPLYTFPSPHERGLEERVSVLEGVLDEIGGLSRFLRQGGPDPMGLSGLSSALERAVDDANAALHDSLSTHAEPSMKTKIAGLEAALRNIAEGNLGDAPWQANYDRIRAVAAAALGAKP